MTFGLKHLVIVFIAGLLIGATAAAIAVMNKPSSDHSSVIEKLDRTNVIIQRRIIEIEKTNIVIVRQISNVDIQISATSNILNAPSLLDAINAYHK